MIEPRDDLAWRRERNATHKRAQQPGVEPIGEEHLVAIERAHGFEPAAGQIDRYATDYVQACRPATVLAIIARLRVAEAECEAVLGELSAVSSAIGSVRFMDPPDGGDVTLAEQVARMHDALRAVEANQRTLIAALRVNAMRLPTYPGHAAFDAAVAQMIEPGQPIPEPRT